MKITVVGTGYVGLVTAAIFARLGNEVFGLDIDKEKIKRLQNGEIPFFEPDLGDLVKDGIQRGNLSFTTSYLNAVPQSHVVFICVGTPPKSNGDYDLSYVYEAAKEIGRSIRHFTVVVIKSTVPPGTGNQVDKIIKKNSKVPFAVASCPEFLREGSAVWDSFHPSRIVIGSSDKRAVEILLKLHEPIQAPRVVTDIASAQLVKYAANAFLATKISFINAIAIICDKIGADVNKVSQGLGLDPRISGSFLNAGLGYGGSCFPKDTWALISFAKRKNYDFQFLRQVNKINNDQICYFIEKVEKHLGGTLKDKKITILGLSFKPDTDDMRESRSIPLIRSLVQKGAKICASDPVAIGNARRILPGIDYVSDPYQALKDSNALILVTEWKQYSDLDFARIKKIMSEPIILDGRNFFSSDKLKKLGFEYEGIGTR